jgi:CO/xanthine dehydrogenase Mo-binding subunit
MPAPCWNPSSCVDKSRGHGAGHQRTALYEGEMRARRAGWSLTPHRVPQLPRAAVLQTEVFFAERPSTHFRGPLGAKSMSEAPYNPVALARQRD